MNTERAKQLLAQAIPNGECLECHMNKGAPYAKISAGSRGTTQLAHRFIYQSLKGPIPEGLKILHSCDNSRCINPEHLILGTQQDNMLDMIVKRRRGKIGGQSPRLLDAKDISKMLELHSANWSQREIAAVMNVSQTTIGKYLKEADNDRRSAN